ncbi:MAG TPA: helix-turn-helix domain-containing protein [Ktedonobacteraceae bacterium]|nr:helix-turn-helix domain-containing protein [Ktedonobacteraceae bacterium]
MSILSEARPADSPYIETVIHGRTAQDGSVIRPAEICWHMVLRKLHGKVNLLLVGPWTGAGGLSYAEGAELLWIKFMPGTFLSHLPTRHFLNSETVLPEAAEKSFWLAGSTWQLPNFENADTFVNKLARAGVLERDPLVSAALQNRLTRREAIPARTMRHRFKHSMGLSASHIEQVKRAQRARLLLERGVSILDTVEEAGYFDQPHLTRSLKQFIGYTPAQILRLSRSSLAV